MSSLYNEAIIGAAGQSSGYEIEQSLRFNNGDSAHLHRTPSSAGSQTTFTLSVWVKSSVPTSGAGYFYATHNGSRWNGILRRSGNYDFGVDESGASAPKVVTNAKLRDPGAWYHLVMAYDTTQATSTDRVKIWINGELQSINTGAGSYPNLNHGSTFNRTTKHWIGALDDTVSVYYTKDFYLAEYHLLDGTAVANADDFGEPDDNGVWRPIEYTGGNYGTTGFYLKFDPTATNGIGHDHSGNGNNWTASGFTTSGTGTDVMSDTPTTNWCTLNPLRPSSYGALSLSDGNLNASRNTTSYGSITTTIGVSSGKWYWEVYCNSTGFVTSIGITENLAANGPGSSGSYTYHYDGKKYVNGSLQNYSGNSYTSGDLLGFALDMDAGTLVAYKNGTSQGTLQTGLSGTFYPFVTLYGTHNVTFNFGQRAFEQTVPTGYSALNTSNLPAPTVKDGSDYFQTVLYTGNGTDRNIDVTDNSNNNWQPDLVWIKQRSGSATDHRLFDQVRGGGAVIRSNNTNAEQTASDDGIYFAYADGFNIDYGTNGANYNGSGQTYVAWNWLAGGGSGSSNTDGTITSTVSANASAGFSIVTYTGDGDSAATVGHGLGVAPNFVILKRRTGGLGNWQVGNDNIFGNYELYLNTQDGITDGANEYSVTSTVIDLNSSHFGSNANGSTYVAYCFAGVEGYSKFGTYTGNGSSDGPFVYTGFKPAWLMVKSNNGSTDWKIYDAGREPYNVVANRIAANTSNAELDGNAQDIDFVSNGFKFRGTNGDQNSSGTLFHYVVFASSPFGGSGATPATAR